MSIIENAQKYVSYGLDVRVLSMNSKIPPKKSVFASNDVTLLTLNKNPNLNYGVIAGQNHIIVDIDLKDRYVKDELIFKKEEAQERYNILLKKFPNLFDTLAQKTPTGGFHLFFVSNDKTITQTAGLNGYIDIRRGVGYVVGAGSSINNVKYEILDPNKPILQIPEDFKKELESYYIEKNKKEEKKEKELINEEEIKDNEKIKQIQDLFLVDKIKITKIDNKYKIDCIDGSCFVEKGHKHTTNNHSTLFFNSKVSNVLCFSHGNHILEKDIHNKICKIFIPIEKHEYFNDEYFNDLVSKYDYSIQKRYFEQYFCFISTPEPVYIREDTKPITFYKTKNLKEAFLPHHKFINKWMFDSNKRQYLKIDFLLKDCPKNIYNLFDGFEIEKKYKKYNIDEKDKLLKPIFEHFEKLFDNKEVTNYFYLWLANIFQKNPERAGVALVWIASQGVGKGFTFRQILIKMFGDNNSLSDSNPDTFFEKHSDFLANKILINPDEVKGKDTFEVADRLKGLITEPKMYFNPKGLKKYSVSNYANFIITTNNLTPVKIEPTDRRFCVIDLSDKFILDKVYFDSLEEHLKDWKALSAFYDYLLSFDLKGYNFQEKRPKTEAYIDLKEACLPSYIIYLNNMCNTYKTNKDGLLTYKALELLKDYLNWRKENNFQEDKMNSTMLGRLIKKIKGVEKKKSSIITYVINKKEVLDFFKTKNYFS